VKLYHYAVFLRTSRGTVRKDVGLTKRSVSAASRKAQLDVQRHLRELVTVSDCVPLKEKQSKAEPVILKARSRRPITVTKSKFTLSRRPKARVSAILTKRGVRAYTPQNLDERGVTYSAANDSAKLSEKAVRSYLGCENKVCLKRGRCGHKRPPGVENVCHEARVAVGTGLMIIRAFATDEATARRIMRKQLVTLGLGHKRLTKIEKVYAPNPEYSARGERIRWAS